MAKTLRLRTFSDARGNLSVVEDYEIPFKIKRLFYIYGVDGSERAGHRHKTTYMALISLKGGFTTYINNGNEIRIVRIDSPGTCLILEPFDWHKLYDFAPDTILLVCASEYFSTDDYIYEEYT